MSLVVFKLFLALTSFFLINPHLAAHKVNKLIWVSKSGESMVSISSVLLPTLNL